MQISRQLKQAELIEFAVLYIQSGALQGVTVHLGPESVHCDDSWVVVDCPGLTLSYTGLVPF